MTLLRLPTTILSTLVALLSTSGGETILIDYDDGNSANGVHNAAVNNGGFESASLSPWLSTSGTTPALVSNHQSPAAAGGGNNVALTGPDFGGTSGQTLAMDTGHVLAAGDQFAASYWWKDVYQWDLLSGEMSMVLYYTADNTMGGTRTVLETFGGLSTSNDTYQQETLTLTTALSDPGAVGKTLFVGLESPNAGTDEFARTDGVYLWVSSNTTNPDGDSDGDGLPDTWETANSLDPNDDGSINPDNGANGDPDQDGVPNHEELFYGSDPHNLRDPDANTSHTWKPRPEKIQLMVVNCHADDEGIFFGGLIPYYTQVREIPTINICMSTANSSSTREREFRNACWVYGQRVHPVFLRFGSDCWNTNTLWTWLDCVWPGWAKDGFDGRTASARAIATYIRRYRPEVVVTHDFYGEYGHGEHIATSLATIDAIAIANDPAVDLDGLPIWQVKKAYVHNDGADPFSFPGDASPTPSPAFIASMESVPTALLFHDYWGVISIDTDGDGTPDKTPRDLTALGLKEHASQGSVKLTSVYNPSGTRNRWKLHSSEHWGLFHTTVGPDTVLTFQEPYPDYPSFSTTPVSYTGWAKGDFFEHLTTFKDSDADQLPNEWEIAHWPSSPANPTASYAAADPEADDDNDGFDNHYEFVAGLDPHTSDRVDLAVVAATSSIDFTVPAASGSGYDGLQRRYRLHRSTDMLDWSEIVAEGIANGITVSYPIPNDGVVRQFYRLELIIE